MGIAVGRDAPERSDHDGQAGFLETFPGGGLRGVFARLALAAGEFPVAGVDRPGRPLPDQETVAAPDQADADLDRSVLRAHRRSGIVVIVERPRLGSACRDCVRTQPAWQPRWRGPASP